MKKREEWKVENLRRQEAMATMVGSCLMLRIKQLYREIKSNDLPRDQFNATFQELREVWSYATPELRCSILDWVESEGGEEDRR